MSDLQSEQSPRWGWTTKLIVGLTLVAIGGWLIVKFQNFVGPLMLVFMLAYVFHPVAKRLSTWLKLPWRLAVSLIYLILLIVLVGLLTLGGLALINQLQSLINFIQNTLYSLPQTLQDLAQKTIYIGPFTLALSQIPFNAVSNQILSAVQPFFGQIGSILGFLASGAATLVGWLAFIVLVSYFILVESEGIPNSIIRLNVPGYADDIKRLGMELSHVWNAFLRGQLIIIASNVVVYAIVLTIFGLPFPLGLAVIAGISKLIPYIGPLVMWTTYGLVSYFAASPPLGIHPIVFAIIVVACSMLIDSTFDNLISPRIMSQALKVHPAMVLIAALIGASLLGLIGILVAAPVLATVKLLGSYIFRKMLDQDPWQGMEIQPMRPPSLPIARFLKTCIQFFRRLRQDSTALFVRLRKKTNEKH